MGNATSVVCCEAADEHFNVFRVLPVFDAVCAEFFFLVMEFIVLVIPDLCIRHSKT